MTKEEHLKNGYDVTLLFGGQLGLYQDTIYKYIVVANKDVCEERVRDYCMNTIRKSYFKKDMPHPFAPKLEEFHYLEDETKMLKNKDKVAYYYKTRELYTG